MAQGTGEEVKEVREVEDVRGGPLSASEMVPADPTVEIQRLAAEIEDAR